MSTSYTGDKTLTRAPAPLPAVDAVPIITVPADGDTLNVASVEQMIKSLTDYMHYVTTTAMFAVSPARSVSAGHTFNAQQVFNGTNGSDTSGAFQTTETPTNRKLLWDFKLDANEWGRMYADAGVIFLLTINARWNGSNWVPDDAAKDATRLNLGLNQFKFQFASVGELSGGVWAEGVWAGADNSTFAFNVTNGSLVVYQAVTTTTGDFTATAGSFIATGTVAGATGPGLIKARRFYATGTSLVAGDFSVGAGYGASGTAAPVGVDAAGTVTITTGGAGLAADPTWTLTFKDGTFTAAPQIICQFVKTDDGTIDVRNSAVEITSFSATAMTITLKTNAVVPTTGKTFKFNWHAIGVS